MARGIFLLDDSNGENIEQDGPPNLGLSEGPNGLFAYIATASPAGGIDALAAMSMFFGDKGMHIYSVVNIFVNWSHQDFSHSLSQLVRVCAYLPSKDIYVSPSRFSDYA